MITTIIISSVILNLILVAMVYSFSKETKPSKSKIVYKEKIVYRDKPVEKIVYKDRIVEKVIYKDKIVHEFIRKEEPEVSPQRKELMDALKELKAKKKKSKKDLDNIYTIEKILPNIK